MLSPKKLGKVFYKSVYDTVMQDGIEHAGYLAFLALLSFFPFLVLLVSLAGIFGETKLGSEFVSIFVNHIPEHFIAALKPRIEDIVSGPPPSLKAIAIIAMIWTASAAVEGLRTILNRAYRVSTPPAYIYRRLMSILQFLVLMVLVLIAMFMIVLAPPIVTNFERLLNIEEFIKPHWTYIRFGLAGVTVFMAVAVSYYILPNIRQKWSHVWPGTLIVMVLWLLAGSALSGYIENFDQVNLVYGSLEGIIIALLFFDIMALVYIFGAEFNYHIEKALGNKVLQKVRVSEKDKRTGDPTRKTARKGSGKPAKRKTKSRTKK